MKFVDDSQNLRGRLQIVQVLILVVISVLAVRLYLLQIIDGHRYADTDCYGDGQADDHAGHNTFAHSLWHGDVCECQPAADDGDVFRGRALCVEARRE